MMHAEQVAQDPQLRAQLEAELARRQGGQAGSQDMTERRASALEGGAGEHTYGLQAQSEKMQAIVPVLSELEEAFHGQPTLMSAFAGLVKALQKVEKDGSF